MKLGIVTDSTSDLPKDLIERFELEVIPTILVIEGKEYADGRGISREAFYAQLPEMKNLPTTAAPSLGEFSARYQGLFARGCDHILSIHAAEQLTTIVNIARRAAMDFLDRVTVIDSGSLTLGTGFQVLAAAEAAEKGLQAALNAVRAVQERLRVYAALDTMENLRRSGRVPTAVAALGGLLSIKPVIELAGGVVKAIGAVRTTEQANERLVSLMHSCGAMERLAILHTGAEARARSFLKRMMGENSQSLPRDILLLNVTPVIGTHLGANGLGFAAVQASTDT
ncbi:MAG: DegV family protein [Anaerolineales bacterium]